MIIEESSFGFGQGKRVFLRSETTPNVSGSHPASYLVGPGGASYSAEDRIKWSLDSVHTVSVTFKFII
jgi:hypothetical protein